MDKIGLMSRELRNRTRSIPRESFKDVPLCLDDINFIVNLPLGVLTFCGTRLTIVLVNEVGSE